MKRAPEIVTVLAAFLALAGCTTAGAFTAANVTNVELAEGNYEVVATNVEGEASAGYVLGASASLADQMRTAALFRVSGSGMLYGEALRDLWDNFRADHGETEGRELALVNVRFDSEALNLILYTEPTVMVRADVVEFTD